MKKDNKKEEEKKKKKLRKEYNSFSLRTGVWKV
jgi:hypothetical protein